MDPIGTLRYATDVGFLNHARRAILPLPLIDSDDTAPADALPPFERRPRRSLKDKRIGVVGRGGVATVGVARAFEEAAVRPAAIAANRESAIWGAMWAGGMTADEMAEASPRWRPQDHLGIQWTGAPRLVVSAARGFSGLDKARALEQLVPRELWRMAAGHTEVPFRTAVRDLDFGGVEHFGSQETPELTVGELVRIACAAPRRGDAVRVEGGFYVGDDPPKPPLDDAGFDRLVTGPDEPVGFVSVFIDRRGWPDLIRRGHADGAAALATRRRRSGRRA